MALDITYIISDNLDFEFANLVFFDHGPEFPKRMGWPCQRLDADLFQQGYIYVIDPRMSLENCTFLKNRVRTCRDSLFVFAITDPYEHHRQIPYFQLLFDVILESNTIILSRYRFSEIVWDLYVRDRKKVFFLPNPYVDFSLDLPDWNHRTGRILFSGAIDWNVYPHRTCFHSNIAQSLFYRRHVHKLVHPGYPDLKNGMTRKHDIIGREYVKYISNHRFFFITPSRCDCEFLKYTECAAALSLPVGIPASTLPSEAKQAFVTMDFNRLGRSVRLITSMSDNESWDRAQVYHRVMKKERDPRLLNRLLEEYIRESWPLS